MSNKNRHILLFLALLAPAAVFAKRFDEPVAQTATPGSSEPQQAAIPTLEQSPAVAPSPEIVALQNPNLSADELAKLVDSKLFRISYEMQKLQTQVSKAINPAQKAQLIKDFTALKNLELEIINVYQAQMRLKVGNVRPVRTSAFNRPSTLEKLAKKFKALSRKAKLAAILTPIGILLAAIAGGLTVVGGRKLYAYAQTQQIDAAIAAAATTRQQAQDRSEQARIAAEIAANNARTSAEQAQDHSKQPQFQAAKAKFNAAQARYDNAQQAPNRDEKEVAAATYALAQAEQALNQTCLHFQQTAVKALKSVDQGSLPPQQEASAGQAKMTPGQRTAVSREIMRLEGLVENQVTTALKNSDTSYSDIYTMLQAQQLNYLAFLNFVHQKEPAMPAIITAMTMFCDLTDNSQPPQVVAFALCVQCKNTIAAQCTALRNCGHPICQGCLKVLSAATSLCGFSGCSIPVVV